MKGTYTGYRVVVVSHVYVKANTCKYRKYRGVKGAVLTTQHGDLRRSTLLVIGQHTVNG